MKKSIARKLLLLLLTAGIPSAISAEIAMKYYKAAQSSSGEFLQIRVSHVSLDWCIVCAKRDVVVRAEVLKVHRSAVGLKTGAKITIKYTTWTRRPSGWAGPRAIPILKEGKTYPAFLKRTGVNKRDGVVCAPGARGYSFQLIKK